MKKRAHSEPFENTRELVKFLNENEIERNDIVTVIDREEQLLLIFYA